MVEGMNPIIVDCFLHRFFLHSAFMIFTWIILAAQPEIFTEHVESVLDNGHQALAHSTDFGRAFKKKKRILRFCGFPF